MSANTAQVETTVSTRITREQRYYRVRYGVTTTEASDQGLQALTASGIPRRGDYYEAGDNADAGAFVDSYDVQLADEQGSRRYWHVFVEFTSQASRADPRSPPTIEGYSFPWDAPTEVSAASRVTEKICTTHYSNPATGAEEYLTNSANHFYDDVYRELSHATLRMRKKYYHTSWAPADIKPYIDTVNSASFFGEASGYYKMEAPRWTLLFTGDGWAYYDVEYSFVGNVHGWNGTPHVDNGYYYRDASDDYRKKRFTDDEGIVISGKGKLDGAGDELDDDATPVAYPSGGINRYKSTNYGGMDIPVSITQVLAGR